MDRFVVVACPKCRWVRGADMRFRTVTCPQCGKRWKLSKLAALALLEDGRDLPMVVAAVRASISGENAEAVLEASSSTKSEPALRKRTMEEECMRLSQCIGNEFSREALLAAARENRIVKPEEKLQRLLDEGLLMEPRPGILVWLGD